MKTQQPLNQIQSATIHSENAVQMKENIHLSEIIDQDDRKIMDINAENTSRYLASSELDSKETNLNQYSCFSANTCFKASQTG